MTASLKFKTDNASINPNKSTMAYTILAMMFTAALLSAERTRNLFISPLTNRPIIKNRIRIMMATTKLGSNSTPLSTHLSIFSITGSNETLISSAVSFAFSATLFSSCCSNIIVWFKNNEDT